MILRPVVSNSTHATDQKAPSFEVLATVVMEASAVRVFMVIKCFVSSMAQPPRDYKGLWLLSINQIKTLNSESSRGSRDSVHWDSSFFGRFRSWWVLLLMIYIMHFP